MGCILSIICPNQQKQGQGSELTGNPQSMHQITPQADIFQRSSNHASSEAKIQASQQLKTVIQKRKSRQVSFNSVNQTTGPLGLTTSSTYTGLGFTRRNTETIRDSFTPKETRMPERTETRAYSNYESYKTTEIKSPPAPVSNYESYRITETQAKLQPPDFVPYEGCLGRWIPANEFFGNSSSFGFYKCDSCHKTWMSARSKKQFKQACKACNKYYFPVYLWLNDSKNYEKKEKALVDNLKNHLSDLCEACQKGRCNLNRTSGYTASEYTVSRTMNQDREYSYYGNDD